MTQESAALLQTVAACIQAGGSLIAIVVAIYVPNKIAALERRDRRNRARLIERSQAILLRKSFYKLLGEISRIQAALANPAIDLSSGSVRKHLLLYEGRVFREQLPAIDTFSALVG